MPDVVFVLVEKARYPKPAKVIASAKKLGFALTLDESGKDGMQSYSFGDGLTLIAMMIPAKHPDVPTMAFGMTSPAPAEAEAANAHFIVTALGLEGTPMEKDTKMAALAAAVIDNVPAVGAMFGHGAMFHKAKLFSGLAGIAIEEGELPAELAVDVTSARESETHMSFLTHNLPRYGREDFYVTCPITGKGAFDFVLGLARWMLTDPDKQLPTGDTVGRTPTEKVKIQRVPSPIGNGATVIRLDLP